MQARSRLLQRAAFAQQLLRRAQRIIETALYGVRRGDPRSFAIGAVALVGISGLACFVPAMRATGVDPVVAVRAE